MKSVKSSGVRTVVAAVSLVIALSACGGGGGDDGPDRCEQDLNVVKSDPCWPQIVTLADNNDVTEADFLNDCRAA